MNRTHLLRILLGTLLLALHRKRVMQLRVIAITLAAVGILSAGAAEATPVTNGFYRTTINDQNAMFSGDNFAVSMNVGGGAYFLSVFNAGTLLMPGVGTGTIFNSTTSTIQIGSNSCAPVPGAQCGAVLNFMFAPNLLPPGTLTVDAPFTMTGMLRVGSETLNIEGSGTFHAINLDDPPGQDFAQFNFTVPEPSTVVLVLSGFVAMVGWRGWRGGWRAG